MIFSLLMLGAWQVSGKDYNPYLVGRWDSTQDAWQVQVRNNIAYLANDQDGLKIISVSNPASPVLLGTYTNVQPAIAVSLGIGPSVNYAYVATGGGGVDVVNISNPSNPQLVGNIFDDVLDLEATAVLVSPSGNYLFIADSSAGVKIFRITNPNNIDATNLLGTASTYGTAGGMMLDPNNLNRLYVADGEQGLTRVNITTLTDPQATGNTPLPGFARAVWATAFTVLVACDDAGLQRVDTTAFLPSKEVLTSTPVYDVAYAGGPFFLACADGGVQLYNPAATTAASPTRIGSYYTGFGVNAYGVTLAGSNVYVAAGGLQILRTNLLANPQGSGIFTTTNELGDASDIFSVGVFGPLALIGCDTFGLQVLNISNPASPKRLTGTIDFGPAGTPTSIVVTDNFAFMAEGPSGFEIVDLTDLTNLLTVGLLDTPGFASAVVVEGNDLEGRYAYLADGSSGLKVFDVTDPNFAADIGSLITGGFANGLAVSNGYVYLADGSKGLTIIDVSNPAQPLAVGGVATGGNANDIALAGHFAFIADGGIGLSVIDITDPLHPVRVAGLNVGDTANGIAITGDYAYMTDGLAGLIVIDISNPRNPRVAGGNTSFEANYGITVNNGRVYVPAGNAGLRILENFQPIRFNSNSKVITNTFHVFVSGPTNGQPHRIQRSTNLVASNGWADWQTLTFANTNFVELVDTNYPANQRRFYRAVAP